METRTTEAFLLLLASFAGLRLTEATAENDNISMAFPGTFQGMPISVDVISNLGVPGVLFYNRESRSFIQLNYSLNCASYDTVYTIIATTSAEKVATIKNNVFNVSCVGLNTFSAARNLSAETHVQTHIESQDSVLLNESSSFIGVVTGSVNISVKARMIGRSFLLLFAHKLSGADLPKTIDTNKGPGIAHLSTNEESFLDSNTTSKVTEARKKGAGQSTPGLPPNVVGKAMIIVMQLPRTIDEVFRVTLYVVIVLATVGMGVKVDLVVIKHVMRRPTAPLIGLFCQYIGMPLIAFLVAKVIPQENAAVSLGIFACGIAPGGGPSNMFTYLLGGDLSLSVAMTTLSNIAALGLLPMWIFTLGDTFKDDTVKLHVPYEKILEALAVAILPLFVGIFIKYKLPRVARIISKILKPVLIIIVAFTISFGIYINVHIFEMIRPMTIVAGCLLPYIGYLLGGLVAFLCCQSWTHIKTIAIETGIQNVTIAFLILYMSLPPPDNQLATVGPAASAIMTPLPLFVAVFFYTIYQRYINKRKTAKNKEDEMIAEHGNVIIKEKGETVTKAILSGDETAAIILLWNKITGRKPKSIVLEEILNKELEIMAPES